MAVQTAVRPDTRFSRQPAEARKPRRVLWIIVLVVGMALAGVVGVVVATYVTNPPAPTQVVTQEPNANEREGRVAVTATALPNANEREGLVAVTATALPNANERESRVATH